MHLLPNVLLALPVAVRDEQNAYERACWCHMCRYYTRKDNLRCPLASYAIMG